MIEPVGHSYLKSPAAPLPVAWKPYFKRGVTNPNATSGAAEAPWTLPNLCKAYDWPTTAPGGGVIAIVELGGGWVASDMNIFFASINQPTPTITDVSVDGSVNNPNQHLGDPHDPDIEVTLDIQVAGAAYYIATGTAATIRVYWAAGNNPSGIAEAVKRATADGCDVCSISWGSDEANWQANNIFVGIDIIQDMENAAQAATAAGMIVFAATGDNDSSDGGRTPANVDMPSSCPHVVACGGTTKTANTETVWNWEPGNTKGDGTGGGYSTIFPPQAWQIGASGPGRMIPDVSANADPHTGYWIFVHNQSTYEGGTSAVAPFYAGLFASFGRKLGWITPMLYKKQTCFNDITQGDNGDYRASIGPDPCTGIGTPIGTRLEAAFANAAPQILATATPIPTIAHATGYTGSISARFEKGMLVALRVISEDRTTHDFS